MKSKPKNKSPKQQPKPKQQLLPCERIRTPEEFGALIKSRMSECFDGFVVVGFRADTGQPAIVTEHDGNHTKAFALSHLLNSVNVPMPDEE